MEGEPRSLDHEAIVESPLKRKLDLVPPEERLAERTSKHQKPDAGFEELRDAGQDEKKGGADQNGNAHKGKGKSILSAADKGKGKMVVEEEGSDDEGEDGSSEVDGDGDDDDVYLSDDPLEEVDLDNILPVRTRRRRTFEPGAYLVEGYDDDDDDDDDDEDEEEDDDSDGDEEDEKEEKHEETK